MNKGKYARRGFTLIELLIVVAIIAILALIAVPNFLEAQMRAKVSRIQAELRTCAVAFEAYHTDHNYYPSYNNVRDNPIWDAGPHFLPYNLTTPIAYLTSLFDEIFEGKNTPPWAPKLHEFHYFNRKQSPDFFQDREDNYFNLPSGTGKRYHWVSWSNGPDQWCDVGNLAYDPTNGTISAGDIVRWGP